MASPAAIFDNADLGFDVGVFDQGNISVTKTDSCSFTDTVASTLSCPTIETLAATDDYAGAIIVYPTDTLIASSEVITTGISTTETDELTFLDFCRDGFDYGVFDTVLFDSECGPTVWTTLIATIVDSISINLERIYTEGQVQYAENLSFSDAVTSQIAATVLDSLDTLEVVATQLTTPAQTDSFTLADLSTTTLIQTILDSTAFTEAEATQIVATIADQLDHLETISTKITATKTDTLVLTELTSTNFVILLLSHMTDEADLDSSIIDSITLISKVV